MKLAMYLRLSKEEEGADESNSIKNQRIYIKEYIFAHKDLRQYDCYEFKDDGLSGKSENRPGFERMMNLVKAGEINCVIVKDMSRFSRDQIVCGKYREQIFPFMGVRFIAINDNYDSDRTIGGVGGIDIAFKEILYDMYSEDLSEKVKSSLHTKRASGKYIATSPPYGYKKSECDKHKLEIDEPSAVIVKRIFKEYLDGKSMYAIRKDLNAEGVPCPARYQYEKGLSTTHRKDIATAVWSNAAVSRILHNDIYIGNITYGKAEAASTGSKKKKLISKDEWKTIEHCHKAIIRRKDFEAVQEKMRNNNSFGITSSNTSNLERRESVFGKLYCKGCGKKLSYSGNGNPKYFCSTIYSDKECDNCVKSVLQKDIDQVVLSSLNKYIKEHADIDRIISGKSNLVSGELNTVKESIADINERINLLKGDLRIAYENYHDQVLTKEEYLDVKKNNDALIREYEARKLELEAEKKNITRKIKEIKSELISVETITNVEEMNKELENIFIDKICISVDNEIEILWKFSGIIKFIKKG